MLAPNPDPRAARLRQQLARAMELHQTGRLEQAGDLYRKVLRLQPDHFDALHMLGVAALQSGRCEYARDLISRAIRVNPNVPAAHGNLALACIQQEKLDEAVASYRRQIELQPDRIEAYTNLAALLGQRGRRLEALDVSAEAIVAAPRHAVAHLTHALALKDVERYEESLAACERALELQSDSAVAWDKRGAALRELGQLDAALLSHQKAIAIQPDLALAHLHAGMVHLLSGDFARGWPAYEWRTKPGGTVQLRGPEHARWTGAEPLEGATLLLYGEQGLGDTIQFCRYAHLAELQCARVVLAVPEKLCRLIQTLSPTITVVADSEPLPPYDRHCPLLSLPLAFKTTLRDVPARQPYLFAEQNRVDHWREVVGQEGFKIGIAWQGSQLPIDVGRSFPLARLHDIAVLPGIRLISLQKNAGTEQLGSLPNGMRVESFEAQLDCGTDAFLDTAAIMQNLDLVITSDTAIAHLAGALGRPTWVALKHMPDWRWLLDRDDTPWYPTLRLFRQTRRGDWTSVFERMRAELMRPT